MGAGDFVDLVAESRGVSHLMASVSSRVWSRRPEESQGCETVSWRGVKDVES